MEITEKNENKRLGRGLSALLSQQAQDKLSDSNSLQILEIDIRKIKPNPYQPRQQFDPEKLIELADSIRSKGVFQPLLVKKEGDFYILVFGERRLRAAKIAGFEKIPVMVKEIADSDMVEMAVLENIQREDLSPVEEANAYEQLMKEHGVKIKDLSKKIGKSIPYISNKTRLLQLCPEVLKALQEKEITEGHARALIPLESRSLQNHALRLIIRDEMNVRMVERLVNKLKQADSEDDIETKKVIQYVLSAKAKQIQNSISSKLKLPTQIVPLKEGGKIVIKYKSDKDLDRIMKGIA
ncbi:MAG TPA: ParB/RepB/Spo0J family partition protein [Candidatus Dojkabacteria bacterium]|nr:ParB/RepB/Spo0J family partition protein [Candidatus Dojkabacteria bacterium]HQF37025.1 ParB/RepB/Spo0J family partition protein [Candidatus Dojkabacteria bacterium]